jgi:hypothetical protein
MTSLLRNLAFALLLAAVLLAPRGARSEPHDNAAAQPPSSEPAARFEWIDAYIDPKGIPLAAYQFELTAQGAGVTLAGVEGGEHPAYAEPPYYDPHANLQNRIVIAAFNTGSDLPARRTRVARVMLRVQGAAKARFSARLDVAASSDAKSIPADIQVTEGAAP